MSNTLKNLFKRPQAPSKPRFYAAMLVIAFLITGAAWLLENYSVLLRGAAPDALGRFSYETPPRITPDYQFEDDAARVVDLASYRGQLVVLNFWATWCLPCLEEMPALNQLSMQAKASGIAVVPVSFDAKGRSTVLPFYQHLALDNLPLYLDSQARGGALFRVPGLPATVIIDPDGTIIGRVSGKAAWDDPEVLAFLQKLRAQAD